MQSRTLQELADHVGGRVRGDGNMVITAVSTINEAKAGEITFLANDRYKSKAKTTKASAIIVSEMIETEAMLLIVQDSYYAYMQIVVLMYGHRKHRQTGLSMRASVSESARVGENCHIQDYVTIREDAQIGSNCNFYPGVVIGRDVTIGDDCILYPNVVVYEGCTIGSRVIIQANATIGQDGYGFATHEGVHHKIPQIGKVVLEDDVEIGAGCTIQRAALGDTVIGKGSKLGDVVVIGHGVKIGSHSLLVPQVCVAGSTTIGHHCVIGGQAGIIGHIKIGDMVTIGAQSGVANDLADGATVLGAPAVEASLAKRAWAIIQYLPEMKRKLKRLEKTVEKLHSDKPKFEDDQ